VQLFEGPHRPCVSEAEACGCGDSLRGHRHRRVQESVVFTGLSNPTAVRFASDGRIFVAEKSGLISVHPFARRQLPWDRDRGEEALGS
jgi:hypothetical protein